jgi:hypothetical protein
LYNIDTKQVRGAVKHFIITNSRIDNNLKTAIFGPLEPLDEIIEIELNDLITMAVEAGVFPSRGQARKNGFTGPAPHGVSLFGTKKRRFWVWCPREHTDKVVCHSAFDRTDRWFSHKKTLDDSFTR